MNAASLQQEDEKLKLAEPKRLLLVEDNETNQIVASGILGTMGFQIDIANDGIEGVEKARENSYDMILMDIQMPRMDGFEASRAIRKFDTETPIIALSAAVMEKDKELSQAAGMNAHIAKPIDREELYSVLRDHFELTTSKGHALEPEALIELKHADVNTVHQELMIGAEKLYSMYNNYRKEHCNIEKRLEELEINSEAFSSYIHALKGVSGNLRIGTVHTLCIGIEDAQDPSKELEALKNEMQLVCKEIREKITPLVEEQKSALSGRELLEYIESLREDIEVFNYIPQSRIDTICNALESEDEKEGIAKAFQEKAFEALDRSLQSIQERLHGE